jgi:hypothetical protein
MSRNARPLNEVVRMFPTPQASDATVGAVLNQDTQLIRLKSGNLRKISKQGVSGSIGLARYSKMFPTPTNSMMTNSDFEQARFAGNDPRRPKYADVKQYPTPVASGKLNGGTRDFQRLQELADAGQISEDERRSMAAGNGGELNPDWVEWLMGFPQGWTALEPLDQEVMDKWRVNQYTQWQEEPAPRLSEKTPNRVNRLKGLGNGQVPAVVAAVWKLLTEGVE